MNLFTLWLFVTLFTIASGGKQGCTYYVQILNYGYAFSCSYFWFPAHSGVAQLSKKPMKNTITTSTKNDEWQMLKVVFTAHPHTLFTAYYYQLFKMDLLLSSMHTLVVTYGKWHVVLSHSRITLLTCKFLVAFYPFLNDIIMARQQPLIYK